MGHNNKEVVVFKEEQQPHSPTDRHERHERLTARGIAPTKAEWLIKAHAGDAIDAADTAKPRNPAGWIIAALRGRWDTTDLAANTRTTQATAERRRQADTARQQADRAAARDRQRADGWLSAVSAALNDDQLTRAIRNVTTEIPGLQRRSLPMARTQLLRWAMNVHSDSDPNQPFTEALLVSLPTASPPRVDDDLAHIPDPPDTAEPYRRLAACLHHTTTPGSDGQP